MLRVYRDDEGDLREIANERIAVIGYGIQGRAQALNLRDSGLTVELSAEHLAAQRATAAVTDAPRRRRRPPLAPQRQRCGQQRADHPWHHVVAQYETEKQLAAARRAWKRVQP